MAGEGKGRGDLAVMLFLALTTGFAFGLPLPSMRSFIQSARDAPTPGLQASFTAYSLVVSAYNVGEAVGAHAVAFLRRRYDLQLRHTLILISAIGLCGGVVYAMAPDAWVAVVGRVVTGLWSGGYNTVLREWVAVVAAPFDSKKGAMKLFSLFGFVGVIGMAVSPGIGGLFDGTRSFGAGPFAFDRHRWPGWFVSIMLAVSLLILPLFRDDAARREESEVALVPEPEDGPKRRCWDTGRAGTVVACGQMLSFFWFSFGFVVLESMATPIMADQFGLDVGKTAKLYFIAGGVTLLGFIALTTLGQYNVVSDTTMAIAALFLLSLGFWTCVDYQYWFAGGWDDPCGAWSCSFDPSATCLPQNTSIPCAGHRADLGCVWMRNHSSGPCDSCPPVCANPAGLLSEGQLYVGFALINLAFVIGRVTISTLFANTMPAGKAGAGMNALLVSIGSVARIVGPMVAIAAYEAMDHKPWLPMGGMGICSLAAALYLAHLRHRVAALASSH